MWVYSHKTTVVATKPSSLAKHHKSDCVTSGYTLGHVCAESLENTNCCWSVVSSSHKENLNLPSYSMLQITKLDLVCLVQNIFLEVKHFFK